MTRVSYSAAAAAMAVLLAACVATGQTPAPSGTPSLLIQGGDDAAEPDAGLTGPRSETSGTTNGATIVTRTTSAAIASATAGTTGEPVNMTVTVRRLAAGTKPSVADKSPSLAEEQPVQAVDAPTQADGPAAAPPPSPSPPDGPPGAHLPTAPSSVGWKMPASLFLSSCLMLYVYVIVWELVSCSLCIRTAYPRHWFLNCSL